MKKRILLAISILFACTIQSCLKKDKSNSTANTEVVDSLPSKDIEETSEESEENIPEEPNVTYPKTGNKIADFLPKLDIYDVQYEAEGDLNNDGLADIAFVLKHKQSNLLKRPTLILLQNEDKSYRLGKVSNTAMPIEYNDFDYKLYDTEDISIEKGELQINLYGGGPSGTHLSTFKFVGSDFILTTMETHYSGAGGRSGLFYDYEKGEITTTETNTMKEDEPTTSETTKVKTKLHPFESISITDFFNEDDKS
ncbi:hypothetical protein [Flavobacterium sp. ACN6]|uniref:hypothetical protein n=1 Tax=Flavobacterium sp. ACN6 TaxID=1920426 RepID=UPI000BB3B6D9|nr:hypothetical protein [Flavobacterium sp. ACN6]PBJ07340.1 hypothetical protein BSF42_38800 [Flavobacterium sp. ACN6]